MTSFVYCLDVASRCLGTTRKKKRFQRMSPLGLSLSREYPKLEIQALSRIGAAGGRPRAESGYSSLAVRHPRSGRDISGTLVHGGLTPLSMACEWSKVPHADGRSLPTRQTDAISQTYSRAQ